MAKRFFLSLALLLTAFVSTWAEDVRYIYYTVNSDGKAITKHEDGSQANPTVLTSSVISNSDEDNLGDGWYVLNSTFTYPERIVISGDVKLILKDGCTLTAQKGIRINTKATLTIYAQSEGDGMGKLVAQIAEHDKAAIGGNKNFEAGRLFVHTKTLHVHDTTRQVEQHYITINDRGDTIKEVHHYHDTERTIIVDSTDRYKAKNDSLQRLLDRERNKEKTVEKKPTFWAHLKNIAIDTLIILALLGAVMWMRKK